MRTFKLMQWIDGEYKHCGIKTSEIEAREWVRKRSNATYYTIDKASK